MAPRPVTDGEGGSIPRRPGFRSWRICVMTTLLCIAASSFLSCLLLTPLARRLALRLRLVDVPDGRRKMHGKTTPVAGGLAILVAGILTVAAVLVFPNPVQEALRAQEGL